MLWRSEILCDVKCHHLAPEAWEQCMLMVSSSVKLKCRYPVKQKKGGNNNNNNTVTPLTKYEPESSSAYMSCHLLHSLMAS
jgi:hypothetical protein